MSAATKGKGLGRGLGALMGEQTISALDSHAIHELDINDVSPNQSQPRKDFNPERLQELADSIKENGVIQPIIVTQQHGTYLIVAGERRWRAARLAGLKKIPAIVRELSNAQILQQALIENLQRQDLNPIETAEALKKLADDYHMTQEKLSTTVGMSRPALANTLRLLNLPPKIRQMLVEELLTQGHARALLALPDWEQQEKYADL
ncbi:ParB/RepB/Spo0J family partition protein, partial [Oscillospiraceae bacterium HV4-5-C5C]|nr:ParB/RepB/Spo0J family partition protein [Oscillospiraceae bacterium HV4-5-C5C]